MRVGLAWQAGCEYSSFFLLHFFPLYFSSITTHILFHAFLQAFKAG